MSKHNELSDEEFVPFLRSLGVETYNKSFEWMLTDPSISGVFSWLYTNLDSNNSLTAREEYRYAEIQKANQLLSPEDLEAALATIQQDFPGICLPGDQESLEDVKLDIALQKEKLHALEKEEIVLKDLMEHYERINKQLSIEITNLNSAQQQYNDDEAAAASECLTLAEEVETQTEGVVEIIADTLDMYRSCHFDKDTAKKFLTFGPLDQYRQSQALFRSHFDLYTARKFNKKQYESFTEELRTALADARILEDRLSDAALAYIESRTELCGEQAKLEMAANYNDVHSSQIVGLTMEVQSALELAVQEENILQERATGAVTILASTRRRATAHTAVTAYAAYTEQILADLTRLLEVSQQALALDKLLYCGLRHELRTIEEFAQFASQLKDYVESEGRTCCSRIESMSDIISAQAMAMSNLKSSDIVLQTLNSIMGCQTDDVTVLAKRFGEMGNQVKELNANIEKEFRRKEEALRQLKTATKPLRSYIFDGCTSQPNCHDRALTTLAYTLRQRLQEVDTTVNGIGEKFTTVKNGDNENLRKLWQWFLTDTPRLVAAVKGIQGGQL